jgi:exosortase A
MATIADWLCQLVGSICGAKPRVIINMPNHLYSMKLSRTWYHALTALVLLLGVIVFGFRDTAQAMILIWARSETFTHGFLVFPIVLWLIWRKRVAIGSVQPTPLFFVFPIIIVTCFVWLAGTLAAVNSVTQFAFVAILVLSVLALLGLKVFQIIAFPLLFSFFAVPVGEFLMPQLMSWTADFTVAALRMSGIPVYREGLQFVIPTGNWSVVEACSGVRYLIASLTVGTLFAYLSYSSTSRRLTFVVVSVLVPVVANWLRAYLIVMLGHLSGNKLAAGVDHLIYGWLFFGIVILLMFMIGARWADPLDETPSIGKVSVDTAGKPEPVIAVWATAAALALLTLIPSITLFYLDKDEIQAQVEIRPPSTLASDWQLVAGAVPLLSPAFHNPTTDLNATYTSARDTVGLYLGIYRSQNADRKMISSVNSLVSSKDASWVQSSSSLRATDMGGNAVSWRVAQLRAVPGGVADQSGAMAVWQIYWINGHLTGSDYAAKVYSAWYRLTGRRDDSAVIIVYALKSQTDRGEIAIEQFLNDNYASVDGLLRTAFQMGR